MSAMLEAVVTANTEEIIGIVNEEVVRVTNILNILNMTSANDIYWLKNGSTNIYKPSNFIHVSSFKIRSVLVTITSLHGDAKTILVKTLK